MIYKKLIKNISVVGRPQPDKYTGESPINVDNNTNTISIDTSGLATTQYVDNAVADLATKEYVNNAISQIPPEETEVIVRKQTTEANRSDTNFEEITVEGKVYRFCTITKVFDKSILTYPLNKLKNVDYHRYNTNYDPKYTVAVDWYRINTSSSSTGSGGTDRIYVVFQFVNITSGLTQEQMESFLSASNRNMLTFRFEK